LVLSLESVDPITVEVVRSSFGHIAREMKATIHKTAYSTTIQEAQDYSIALFRGNDAVAFEYGIPAHVGAMPRAVQEVLQARKGDGDLVNGDVVLWNIPYFGGSHTPDVTAMKCVEVDDITFYPIVRAHWSDVGGMTPGSLSGKVTEIFQEGLLMPPIKITENGKMNQEVFKLVMANMRLPFQRKGDLRAEVAACDVAEERIRDLCAKYGASEVDRATDVFLKQTEERTLEKIRRLKPGDYEYEDYLDSDGHSTEPYRIHAVCKVTPDNIFVDFEGTSEQAKGPINTVLATTESGVIVTLKCMLDPLWPLDQASSVP
jgi:N-methylhydantoinase B